MQNELYRELVDYIYNYQQEFQTKAELAARRYLMYDSKNMSENMKAIMRSRGWIDDSDEVKALIAGGFEALKKSVVERIYREHKGDLKLNVCPQCGKIARTPLARQCRFCFHQWHQKA